MCGSICKILIGIVLLIIGLWLLLPLGNYLGATPYIGRFVGIGWNEFVTVVIGVIPALLVLFGVLLVWIEAEELKLEIPKKKIKR